MSPLSSEARKLYRNHTALLWCDHAFAQEQNDQFDRLGTMLGTRWTRDQVAATLHGQKDKRGAASDTVMIPLAFIVQPEFAEALKSIFGAGSSHKPGWVGSMNEIIEAADLPREQFLAMAASSSVSAQVQQLRMSRGDAPQPK